MHMYIIKRSKWEVFDMVGLIGKKLGMTQVYNEKEELVPVTIVAAGPCPVVQVKTADSDGYGAVQVAFDEIPARKANKPRSGQFAKAGIATHRQLKEFRTDGVDASFEVGQVLDVSQFEAGDVVRVTGRSKGKGFAGVVKRYHFKGKNATHGTPDRLRAPGSIGQGTTPGKVWKGKKMPGQMGNKNVTTRGIEVVRIDSERNLLFLKGAVPGSGEGVVIIRKH